jgi:uncharacterized membrane protein YsdA (DUF1294 family)/cold shock CspA family protein
MRYQGTIVKWNEAKGFGFVMPKGRQLVFVHVRNFPSRQPRPLENALVSYALGRDAKGRCCAVNVRHADEKSSTIELRISVLPMLLALSFVALLMGVVLLAAYVSLIIAILYLVLSLAAFLAYALDKSAAESGRRRTPESTLHFFGLAGGWPGALLAQQLLRHKSSKRAFQATFWLTVMLNGGALTWLASPYGTAVRALLSEIA